MISVSMYEEAIREHEKSFIDNWSKAFCELKRAKNDENKMWLVGPSSYLFSIGGTKFAVDLQIRREKDILAIEDRICEDISALSFVLITHQHNDHFCVPLIKRIAHMPVLWYLPAKMPARFIEAAGISEKNCVRLLHGDTFVRDGIRITAFDTPHVKPESHVELYELGYRISSKDGSILLPGDVRDYNYCGYLDFVYSGAGGTDLCISHLWAGKNALDESAYMPVIKDFVDFSLRFNAKKYFICHLCDIGRKDIDMWHAEHANAAAYLFKEKKAECLIEIPKGGCSYELFD